MFKKINNLLFAVFLTIFIIGNFYWFLPIDDEMSFSTKNKIENIIYNEDFLHTDYNNFYKKDYLVLQQNREELHNLAYSFGENFISYKANNLDYIKNPFSQKISGSLYSEITPKTLIKAVFNKDKKVVDFILEYDNLYFNDEVFYFEPTTIFSLNNIDSSGYLKIGDRFNIDLARYQNDFFISLEELSKSEISLLELKTENLFENQNGSFQDGFWLEEVGDCSKDLLGHPDFYQSFEDGFFILGSENHHACVNKDFDVDFGKDNVYKLSLRYKNITGFSPEIYYKLSNEKGENYESFIPLSRKYQAVELFLNNTIKNANKINIHIYSRSNGEETINKYADFVLSEYRKTNIENNFDPAQFYGKLDLLDNIDLKPNFNIFTSSVNLRNILENQNNSFQYGFWSKDVGNCSSQLPGEPDFSQDLEGEVFVLSSNNHHACVNKDFDINLSKNKIYKLSLDYENIVGGGGGLYYSFSNAFGESESAFLSLNRLEKEQEFFITPRINSPTVMNIHIYSRSNGAFVSNKYSNLSLTEVSNRDLDGVFFHSKPQEFKEEETQNFSLTKSGLDFFKGRYDFQKVESEGNFIIYMKKYSSKDFTLKINDRVVNEKIIVNSNSFGWAVNIEDLCKSSLCKKNSDGSYVFNITLINNKKNFFYLYYFAFVVIFGIFFFMKFKNFSGDKKNKLNPKNKI